MQRRSRTNGTVDGRPVHRAFAPTSVRREAVQQAVAAGALQVVLRAAAAGSTRGMGRVPRLRGRAVVEAAAVRMSEHGAANRARPVAARAVLSGGKGRAVGLRAREHVVHIRRIAAAVDDGALLGERGLLRQVVAAVELGHVFRDDLALRVLPWALADAIAGVDRPGALRAEIGVPRLAAGAGRRGELLAVLVGAVESAQIAAVADRRARDEKAHVALLREDGA